MGTCGSQIGAPAGLQNLFPPSRPVKAMAGLAILPAPVHLSLYHDDDDDNHDHDRADISSRKHPRRRPLPHSFVNSGVQGDNVPVHSLATRKHRAAGPAPTVVHHNKHSFRSQLRAIHTSSSDSEPSDGSDSPIASSNMALHTGRSYPLDMAVPDSPPDLSSSKSSKTSSSFRSSLVSDALSTEHLTHFEDISLNEKHDSYDFKNHKDAQSPPTTRPLHSIMGPRRKQSHTVDNIRTVHVAQSTTACEGRLSGEQASNMPTRQMRPGFRNMSATYDSSSPRNSSDSRSPSPTSIHARHGLQRSAGSIPGSTTHTFLSVQTGANRRRTWAPGRKTVQQLEDEYHDSDEEVPEDAVIWNVPISPLEPFSAVSREPSPKRKSSQSSMASDLALPMYKTPAQPHTPAAVSRPPLHLGLPRSATTGSFPSEPLPDMYSMRERHKSWQNDLSNEAKQISLALEVHACRTSIDSKSNASSTSPTEPQHTNSSSLSLPPVQRCNIMIDPLPISKEKEAALARTRPSWLPPKNKKEERKHLKEWEQMMAQSAIADRRRAAKKLDELETSREIGDDMERIWEDHVLPNWDVVMREPRTRELWWKGLNPSIRGQVWKRAIGNWLQLSPASYARALERSSSLSEDMVTMIYENASVVFPDTGLFKKDTPMHLALVDVLKAYAAYRPSTSYQASMTGPAALLLLNMSPPDAFIALANILNRPLPNAFLTKDRQGIDKWTNLTLSTLQYKFPRLHDHLITKIAAEDSKSTESAIGMPHKSTLDERHDSVAATPVLETLCPPLAQGLNPRPSSSSSSSNRPASSAGKTAVGEELVRPMFESLFAAHLDLETLSRMWDVYVFEGDKLLVRAFTGALGLLEASLYGSTKEEILAVIGNRGSSVGPLDLGKRADKVVVAVREAGKVDRR